jgi:hypothetical protein
MMVSSCSDIGYKYTHVFQIHRDEIKIHVKIQFMMDIPVPSEAIRQLGRGGRSVIFDQTYIEIIRMFSSSIFISSNVQQTIKTMDTYLKSRCLVLMNVLALLLLTMSALAQEQKNIVVSDDLLQQADQLPVKMGSQWMGKVWKMKFGDYSVGESKNKATVTKQKGKFFSRLSESSSTHKFYFELLGPSMSVAYIDALEKVETKELEEWAISANFSIGEDEVLLKVNSFTALITLKTDTTNVWSLIMTTYGGTQVAPDQGPVALLTNGERRMHLVPVTSNKNGNDKRSIPALGYELKEDDRTKAALQFYGGGMMGLNKNIIWLLRDEDPNMKLILAAALTTVLQHKVNQVEF